MDDIESSTSTLIQLAQAGDKEAFALLFVRYRPMVRALCLRMVRDPWLVDDVLQETALQALFNLHRLQQPDRFGAWLAGIGLNVVRNWLRTSSRDAWSWEAISGGHWVRKEDEWQVSPEELVEERDLARCVRTAIAELPAGQREAVVLFYLSGLTYAETAAQLGIAPGAVKTRLHKARHTLRQRLWMLGKETGMTANASNHLVEVQVADVRRKAPTKDETKHLVILEEVHGQRQLPIWIGAFEGAALALHREQIDTPRPLAYACTTNLLDATGARIREVHISHLAEETFYASIIVQGAAGTKTVDARPSDALNLALLANAPIKVEPALMERSLEWRDTWYDHDTQGIPEIVADTMAKWHGPAGEQSTR